MSKALFRNVKECICCRDLIAKRTKGKKTSVYCGRCRKYIKGLKDKLKKGLFDDPEPCCLGIRQREALRKIDKIFGEENESENN